VTAVSSSTHNLLVPLRHLRACHSVHASASLRHVGTHISLLSAIQRARQDEANLYKLINKHADLISSDSRLGPAVEAYLWLIREAQKHDAAAALEFRRRYSNFWQLGAARLGVEWVQAYFGMLTDPSEGQLYIRSVVTALSEMPRNAAGGRGVDLSFASKLVHRRDLNAPIYDAMIADFYLFRPKASSDLNARIDSQLKFYSFLVREYQRIGQLGLLSPVVDVCRQPFPAPSGLRPLHRVFPGACRSRAESDSSAERPRLTSTRCTLASGYPTSAESQERRIQSSTSPCHPFEALANRQIADPGT
jgi:hypothetical protein